MTDQNREFTNEIPRTKIRNIWGVKYDKGVKSGSIFELTKAQQGYVALTKGGTVSFNFFKTLPKHLIGKN